MGVKWHLRACEGSFLSRDLVRLLLFQLKMISSVFVKRPATSLRRFRRFTRVFSPPDTAALLSQKKDLPRNVYKVDIDVKDLQGNGGIQRALVRICHCRNGACMAKDSSVSMGSLAWLAILLPLALLLLLCEFHAAPPMPTVLRSPEQTLEFHARV